MLEFFQLQSTAAFAGKGLYRGALRHPRPLLQQLKAG
jgi:hypothetical protein